MYLIDTSVWIDYFRNLHNDACKKLTRILDEHHSFGITGVIYQEILQGASHAKDFNMLKNYLSTQRFFHPRDPVLTYESAANLFYSCRKKGITIRSTVDCLIAQIAIENDLTLLHHDVDFNRIKLIAPQLKLA